MTRAALVSTLIVALTPSFAGAGHGSPCVRHGYRVVLQNSEQVIAERPSTDDQTFRCFRRRGRFVTLDAPHPVGTERDVLPRHFPRPPGLAIGGLNVAYHLDLDTEVPETSGTYVLVDGPGVFVSNPATPSQYSRVSTVVVQRSGAVAWTACEQGARCEKAGQPTWLYRVLSGADGHADSHDDQAELLAMGAAIDPLSLKLRGSRISWREGGVEKTATLR